MRRRCDESLYSGRLRAIAGTLCKQILPPTTPQLTSFRAQGTKETTGGTIAVASTEIEATGATEIEANAEDHALPTATVTVRPAEITMIIPLAETTASANAKNATHLAATTMADSRGIAIVVREEAGAMIRDATIAETETCSMTDVDHEVEDRTRSAKM